MVRSASYKLGLIGTVPLALVFTLGLTSCLSSGTEEAPPAPGSCAKPFENVISGEVKGSSHIYLKTESLEFLSDPESVISSVELRAVLRGKHNSSTDLSLALNGIKVSRKDGGRCVDSLNERHGEDKTDSKFSLHKMFLNGALPFHLFIAQVKGNKGELKLSLQGKNTHILEAQLVFKGTKYENCAPKPEDPPPVNNDPGDTSITNVIPAGQLTQSTGIQISFANPMQGNTYFCSLDGSPAAVCQSPQVYSNLTNGEHNFKVFAKTASGVSETDPASYVWTVDTIAPAATISNAAALPLLTNRNSMNFEFSANEPGTLLCSVDGGSYEPCQSPHAVADLGEGVHSFAVNVRDQAGNLGEVPDTFQWRVDLTSPVTSITSVIPAAAISNSVSKSFQFAADESSLFECSEDNGSFAVCQSPHEMSGLNEGLHWFEVRARDLAGNLGPASTYSWNIDVSAPVLSIGAVTPAPGVTNSAAITAEFSVSEIADVSCSIDQGAPQACSSPVRFDGLGEGAHVMRIQAVDGAGNSSAVGEISWVMDFTSPAISFGAIAPAGSFINSRELSVPVNSSENSSLLAELNGQSLGSVNSPVILSDLAEGVYSLSVQSSDGAGNLSNIIVHNFTVDLSAPLITLAAADPRDPVNEDNRLFNFSANEEVQFQCQLDGAGFSACGSPAALSGLADGAHVFEVRATDLSGNVSAVLQSSWTVDTQAPVLSIVGYPAGKNISFALSADASVAGFECSLDGAPFSACGANISYNNLSAGQHNFAARATDAAGNVGSGDYAFDVVIPVETFITGAAPSSALTNQRSISLSFVADQSGSTFRCSLDGQAYSACSSPVVYSGLADGGHQIRVYAVDRFGVPDTSPAAYSWTVDGTAPTVGGPGFTMTRNSITVIWSTNEPATSQVRYGLGSTINQATGETSNYVTSHSVVVSGLSSNTIYSLQSTGRDQAGNVYMTAPHAVRTAR